MRTKTALLASMLCLAARTALADPLPNITPDHDFSGTYVMTKPDGSAKTVAVEYGAGRHTARIAVQDNPGYILYDFGTRDAKLVMPQIQKYMDMPALAAQARLVQSGGGPADNGQPNTPPLVQTLGTETIAGHDCRDTKITDTTNGHWSEVCSTAGGIILQVKSDEGDTVVAQTISESTVPDEDLDVPPGYTLFVMPGLPGGMVLPGGMQMPSGMQMPPGMTIPGSPPAQ
jgi:hypothetical protein